MELLRENIIEKSLGNDISVNIGERQKNFLDTELGKTISSAIDIGIRAAFPDLVEEQIINIKDAIFDRGFKEGLSEVINSGLDFGKSAMGIITGNFESASQVQIAVKKGGILDSVSKLLDFSIDIAQNSNLISKDVAKIIKSGKNTIMNTISGNIENKLDNQIKEIDKLEKYCNKWQEAFENKDIESMNKIYKSIQRSEEKIMPIENLINNIKKIDNIQELIKNKGEEWDVSAYEMAIAEQI